MQALLREDTARFRAGLVAALLVAVVVSGLAVVYIGLLRDERWQVLLLAGLLAGGFVLASRRPAMATAFIFVFSMTTQVGINIPRGPAWHHGGASDVFQLFVYDVIFVPLVVLWMVQATARRQLPRPDLVDMVPLAFVAWSALTVTFSVSVPHTLFQTYLALKVYFFYLFVRYWVDSRPKVQVVIMALVVGLLFQSLLIFAQFVLGYNFGLMGLIQDTPAWFGTRLYNRPGGTVGTAPVVGSYLGLLLPLTLAGILVRLPGWQRLLYSVAFPVGMVALTMTLAIGAWVQLGVALLLFGLVFFSRVSFGVPALTTASLGAAAFVLLALTPIGELIQLRLSEIAPITTYGRLELAKVAWNMITANPVFGVGLNTFRFVAPQYDTTGITFVTPVAVHNMPLLVWAETGTVGLLLFFAFPLLVCWRLWDCQRRSGGPLAAFTAAILAGLVGFFVGGLSDVNYANQITIVHFWVVAGLGMAIARLEAERGVFPVPGEQRTLKGVLVGHADREP